MKRPSLHPDELAMQLDAMLPADRALFDAAVAAVAERQALGWRFRLVMIESVMLLIGGLIRPRASPSLLIALTFLVAFRADTQAAVTLVATTTNLTVSGITKLSASTTINSQSVCLADGTNCSATG